MSVRVKRSKSGFLWNSDASEESLLRPAPRVGSFQLCRAAEQVPVAQVLQNQSCPVRVPRQFR